MSEGREQFYVWNGQVVPADKGVWFHPLSDGLLYGLGCFETMALKGGRIRFVNDHRERFTKTIAAMGFPLEETWDDLRDSVHHLSERNDCPGGVARISLHAEGSGVSSLVRVFPGGLFQGKAELRVVTSGYPHPGSSLWSRWKHNNYALNIMAFREGRAAGYDEVLLARDGKALEGALSTLWMLKGRTLVTAPLEEGVLDGVVRGRLLRLQELNGISVVEGVFTVEDLSGADGLFLSNATMLLKPVSECDGLRVRADHNLCAALNAAIQADA